MVVSSKRRFEKIIGFSLIRIYLLERHTWSNSKDTFGDQQFFIFVYSCKVHKWIKAYSISSSLVLKKQMFELEIKLKMSGYAHLTTMHFLFLVSNY